MHVLPAGVLLPLRKVEAAVIFRPVCRVFSAGRICDGQAEIDRVDARFGLAVVYLSSWVAGRVPETGTRALPALREVHESVVEARGYIWGRASVPGRAGAARS